MQLSESQKNKFCDEGYLQLDDVLTSEELKPVIWECEGVVDRRARELHADGRIQSLYEREPFDRRVACLASEEWSIVDDLGPVSNKGPATFHLMRNPKILDCLESLIGSEILCHPTQVVRPRVRDNFGSTEPWRTTDRVPWHQDAGVLRPDGDNTLLVTVWIPLTESNAETGCLLIIPGSHKHGLRHHEWTNTAGIPVEELPPGDPKQLPIMPGGIILFSNMVCHASLPHTSERVRWSLDFRYHDSAKPSGHPYYAGFMVRSRKNPELELTYPEWVSHWEHERESGMVRSPIARWQGAQ